MCVLFILICVLVFVLCNKFVVVSFVCKLYIVLYDGVVDEICDVLESTTKYMNFYCLWYLKIKCCW